MDLLLCCLTFLYMEFPRTIFGIPSDTPLENMGFYNCQLISSLDSFLVRSRTPCPLSSFRAGIQPGMNLGRCHACCHCLWVQMCISPAVSPWQFPTTLPTFPSPWAQGEEFDEDILFRTACSKVFHFLLNVWCGSLC